MQERAHARKYRRWKVNDLVQYLLPYEGLEVYPNPTTGALIIINKDDDEIGYIDKEGPHSFAVI